MNIELIKTVELGFRTMEEAIQIQNKFDESEKFLAKAKTLQQSAWNMKHKSEKAYDKGLFKLCLKLDAAYTRLTNESIYYAKLAI